MAVGRVSVGLNNPGGGCEAVLAVVTTISSRANAKNPAAIDTMIQDEMVEDNIQRIFVK